jgi:hypothetical protein
MKRLLGILAFLAFVAPSPAIAVPLCTPNGTTGAAAVTPGPSTIAQVQVNGICVDISDRIVREGKFGVIPQGTELEIPGVATIELNAVFNADPFITFGTTTTNLVAGPVTYAFLFGTPVVPGFYNHVTTTGGVTVTNGASGTSTVNNSAVFPTYISASGTLGAVPTNLGADLGTGPCTAGPGTPFTITNTCNQGTLEKSFAPAFYDNLEVLLTYTQNDVASVASWSGAVTLTNAVPEPASIMFIALGVVAVAAGYRGLGRRPRN